MSMCESIGRDDISERAATGGANGNPVSARSASDASPSVSADVDLEGGGSRRKHEWERLAEERRKFERNGGGIIGMMLHPNFDQTAWALASVRDDDLPPIFVERLVPDHGNDQALTTHGSPEDRAANPEDLIPWNGHVPLVSERTGRFLGWVIPGSPRPALPLWRRILLRMARLGQENRRAS